jgi:hypothetical protein
MKSVDVLQSTSGVGAEQTETVLLSFERAVAARHLDIIGMGLMEALANGDAAYAYDDLSRDWSTPQTRSMLETVLRDYVNYQEGWVCTTVWIGEYDTGRDLPYNDRNPAYRDPHQRVVVVAERVTLP